MTSLSLFCFFLFFKEPRLISFMTHVTQMADVGGYFGGVLCGKNAFCKRISPKKTWEGFYTGLIFAIFTGIGFHYFAESFDTHLAMKLPLADYALLGVICGLLSVLGDLVESFVKRAASIKDSGSTLGPHGGVYDRIDSMTFVAPFLFWYIVQYERL